MAIAIFKSFRSTVTPFNITAWLSALKLLVDPTTGAPVGIQSQNDGGPDGIWVPIDLTAAQIASPAAAMLADLNATYRLNVAPYTRYQSDGTKLVQITDITPNGSTFPGVITQTVPPNAPQLVVAAGDYVIVYSPFTVQSLAGVVVQGRMDILARPA